MIIICPHHLYLRYLYVSINIQNLWTLISTIMSNQYPNKTLLFIPKQNKKKIVSNACFLIVDIKQKKQEQEQKQKDFEFLRSRG